jgi:CRP-like cAMP-binding protein
VSLEAAYQRSTRVALEIAQFYKAEVTLLHVLDCYRTSTRDADRVMEWTRSELQRLIPDEAPLWIFSTVQVEVGSVVEQILDVADEMSADLIVLGVSPDVTFWPIGSDNICVRTYFPGKVCGTHDQATFANGTVKKQAQRRSPARDHCIKRNWLCQRESSMIGFSAMRAEFSSEIFRYQQEERVIRMSLSVCQIDERCSRCQLRRLGIFCNLTDEARKHFDKIGQPLAYPGRSIVFEEGQKNHGIYVVCAGQVKLFATSTNDHNMILKIARPGDVLGLSATLNNLPYEVTAKTLERASFKHINRRVFLDFLETHAETARNTAFTLLKSTARYFLTRAVGRSRHPLRGGLRRF